MLKLLTRQEFKDEAFKRDKYKYVIPECEQDAVDAHHLDVETSKITVKEVLEYSKIDLDELTIPDNLIIVDYVGLIKMDSLDKWGEKKKEIDSINDMFHGITKHYIKFTKNKLK